jgi:hypothetical protein
MVARQNERMEYYLYNQILKVSDDGATHYYYYYYYFYCIHRLDVIKTTTFQKLILVPYSGERKTKA